MSVHDEHRQRVKQKFRAHGLDTMHDHEVLELLLFFAIPRRDVNPIAHRLIKQFGSLYRVLEEPVEELMRVEGIGESSALMIRLCGDMIRRYQIDRMQLGQGQLPLDSTERIGKYMLPYFVGMRDEVVMLACVDNRGIVLNCQIVGRGSVCEANVSVRKIVELAMRFNASGVVLAHNHPGGHGLPSGDDIYTTKCIQDALKTIGVTLLDHVIIGHDDDDFVSMRESGALLKYR